MPEPRLTFRDCVDGRTYRVVYDAEQGPKVFMQVGVVVEEWAELQAARAVGLIGRWVIGGRAIRSDGKCPYCGRPADQHG